VNQTETGGNEGNKEHFRSPIGAETDSFVTFVFSCLSPSSAQVPDDLLDAGKLLLQVGQSFPDAGDDVGGGA
jgi:hypothetical protein